MALRHGVSTKLDDRIYAMCELKMSPMKHNLLTIYPDLFPIHFLTEKGAINVADDVSTCLMFFFTVIILI